MQMQFCNGFYPIVRYYRCIFLTNHQKLKKKFNSPLTRTNDLKILKDSSLKIYTCKFNSLIVFNLILLSYIFQVSVIFFREIVAQI